MRHLLEVCCPSSCAPTSASSSLGKTPPAEGRSWRLPRASPGMLRSPLWGSRLAPRRSPALYLLWASHPLSLVLREWRVFQAGTSVVSLERLYVWKQAPHNVLDSIEITQAGGLSSRHQSLDNKFKGETSWVLLDLTDQFFPALKSAFLYALPQSWFCYFPCLLQQRITFLSRWISARCEAMYVEKFYVQVRRH